MGRAVIDMTRDRRIINRLLSSIINLRLGIYALILYETQRINIKIWNMKITIIFELNTRIFYL